MKFLVQDRRLSSRPSSSSSASYLKQTMGREGNCTLHIAHCTLMCAISLLLIAISTFAEDLPDSLGRQGGTTFGLWEVSLKERMQNTKDPSVIEAATLEFALKAPLPEKKDEQQRLVRAIFDAVRKPSSQGLHWKTAELAKKFAVERKDVLSESDIRVLLAIEYAAHVKWGKLVSPERDALAKRFAAEPIDETYFRQVDEFMRIVSNYNTELYPQEEMRAPIYRRLETEGRKLTGNIRVRVETVLLRHALELGDEKTAKECERLADEADAKPNSGRFRGDWIRYYGKHLRYREEFALREETIHPRAGFNELFRVAQLAGTIGETEKAVEYADRILSTNVKCRAEQKFDAAAIKALAGVKDSSRAVKNIKALKAFSNSLGNESEDETTREVRWFQMVRRACRISFQLNDGPEGEVVTSALVDYSRTLLWDEEKVVYDVHFLSDAPASADAALRSGLLADKSSGNSLKPENRMGRYRLYNWFRQNAETNYLRAATKPSLAADVPGKEGAVYAAADERGLHVYIKVNDPDAWKSRDRLEDRFYFEYSFQPGGETPWHWNTITAFEPERVWDAAWDSPRKGYKFSDGYIRSDAVSTEKCHAIHIFVPYVMCWTEMPQNRSEWCLALIGNWAGLKDGALGGGMAHELGRGMVLRFALSGKDEAAIRRSVLRQAVAEYKKVRGLWENAEFWSDPDLGDPAFYAEVVKPYLAELDELAKKITEGIKDSETATLCKTKLWDLADFRLALDAKRTAYLKKQIGSFE